MTSPSNPLLALGVALSGAVLAIAGTAFASSSTLADASSCEILASANGGGLAIEATYHAQMTGQGSYQFSVQSAGGGSRTNINQGGGFVAQFGETLTLGRVNVGGASAYDVTLRIDTGGQPVECGGRITT